MTLIALEKGNKCKKVQKSSTKYRSATYNVVEGRKPETNTLKKYVSSLETYGVVNLIFSFYLLCFLMLINCLLEDRGSFKGTIFYWGSAKK